MITTIQKAIHGLLINEPFYAHFLLGAKMVYVDMPFPPKDGKYSNNPPTTAGVAIIEGLPTFFFNRNFVETLNLEQSKGLIKHEVLHLLFRHTDKGLREELSKKYSHIQNIFELANIAQDCAINQYLKEMPEGGVTLQKLSEQLQVNLPAWKSSDYYLEQILKSGKQEEVSDGMGDGFDEHMEDDGTPSEMGKAAVDKLAKQAMTKSAGNLPEGLLKHLGSLPEPKLNWQTLLRNFVARNIIRETKSSYKKMNRRFELPVPGKVQKKSMTLAICVDSSGSVSDESFVAFFAEIQSIAKRVPKVYIIDADCVVQNVTLVKNKKIEVKRTGRGGTMYQPAINEAIKLGCDAIVYMGDFDSADTPVLPKPMPFLWVGVGNQAPPASFGKVIRI